MNILTVPDANLLKIAAPVPSGEDCRELIEEMFQMIRGCGIGLAAPQLGIDKRIIVVCHESTRCAIINPAIEMNTKIRQKLFTEGCLSVPGKQFAVRRWRKVKVRGFNENWEPTCVGGKNYLAAVFQHEIDHLNGVVIGQEGFSQ